MTSNLAVYGLEDHECPTEARNRFISKYLDDVFVAQVELNAAVIYDPREGRSSVEVQNNLEVFVNIISLVILIFKAMLCDFYSILPSLSQLV